MGDEWAHRWKRSAKENRANAILFARQSRAHRRERNALRDENERLRGLLYSLRRNARPMMHGAMISEDAWQALQNEEAL